MLLLAFGKRQAGFSLIEIMAVVFLIAIAFGTVTFMFSGKDSQRQLQKSIERFTVLSQHAAEMASVDGESYGLVLIPPAWREDPFTEGWQYRWQRLGLGGWVDVEEMGVTNFPLPVDISVSIEKQEWNYGEEPPEVPVPIIGFFPGGDVTPFEIEIGHRELNVEVQHIEVDEWGKIVWREKVEAEEEQKEFAAEAL